MSTSLGLSRRVSVLGRNAYTMRLLMSGFLSSSSSVCCISSVSCMVMLVPCLSCVSFVSIGIL